MTLAALLAVVEVERNPHRGGRDREGTIVFPNGSIAVLPSIPALQAAVWKSMTPPTAEEASP